ncbi:hypothetical protein B0H14DRAFT_3434318 [Mycena olivaceomarginata]|nr:hypothetical protein B0H14DRAFT_3434318 [Mycena olivaceomarginata]
MPITHRRPVVVRGRGLGHAGVSGQSSLAFFVLRMALFSATRRLASDLFDGLDCTYEYAHALAHTLEVGFSAKYRLMRRHTIHRARLRPIQQPNEMPCSLRPQTARKSTRMQQCTNALDDQRLRCSATLACSCAVLTAAVGVKHLYAVSASPPPTPRTLGRHQGFVKWMEGHIRCGSPQVGMDRVPKLPCAFPLAPRCQRPISFARCQTSCVRDVKDGPLPQRHTPTTLLTILRSLPRPRRSAVHAGCARLTLPAADSASNHPQTSPTLNSDSYSRILNAWSSECALDATLRRIGFFRSINTDKQERVDKLATFSIVLGAVYMAKFLIDSRCHRRCITTVVLSPNLCVCDLVAIGLTVGGGILQVVVHFTSKSDILKECTDLTDGRTAATYPFGFFGPSRHNHRRR